MADVADIANDTIEHTLSLQLSALAMDAHAVGEIDCEECGVEIPTKRRKAVPWVKTCIECQEIIEERQKRFT